MNLLSSLLQPPVLIFLIPIVAIIAGAVVKISKMNFEHEERLAKIAAGMDPDGEY